MRNLLGGKGAGLAEMANLGLPVPPGFTITSRGLHPLLRQWQCLSEGARAAGRGRARPCRAHHRQGLRRPRQSAAGFGALGCARLDARHDGHGAQSRPQRRRPCEALAKKSGDRRFAYDSLSPLHHHVFRRGARHRPPSLRGAARRSQGSQRLHARHRPRRRRLGRAGRPLQGAARGGAGRAVSAGPAQAAVGRDRRRVRLVDEPARRHLSAPAQDPGKLGHRGQCPGHGVRQHGRDLGHRRRFHAQSFDRREEALRRVPDQRPGRGRGRRHPHAAGDHGSRAAGGELRQAVDGKGDAGGVRAS